MAKGKTRNECSPGRHVSALLQLIRRGAARPQPRADLLQAADEATDEGLKSFFTACAEHRCPFASVGEYWLKEESLLGDVPAGEQWYDDPSALRNDVWDIGHSPGGDLFVAYPSGKVERLFHDGGWIASQEGTTLEGFLAKQHKEADSKGEDTDLTPLLGRKAKKGKKDPFGPYLVGLLELIQRKPARPQPSADLLQAAVESEDEAVRTFLAICAEHRFSAINVGEYWLTENSLLAALPEESPLASRAGVWQIGDSTDGDRFVLHATGKVERLVREEGWGPAGAGASLEEFLAKMKRKADKDGEWTELSPVRGKRRRPTPRSAL